MYYNFQQVGMSTYGTSFCRNEGTDLLRFLRWSGSEKEEEGGDGVLESKREDLFTTAV